MAKFKFKDAAMTVLGATGGAYGAEFVNNQINDQFDDPKKEIGAKLVAVAVAAYFGQSQKGAIKDAITTAIGVMGASAINSAKDLMPGGSDAPTKGIDDELEGIYDEIDEALNMNGTQPTVTGNDATVTGNEGVVTGASYDDDPEND